MSERRTSDVAPRTAAPVAIIGIGCRFPGGVTDAASFWRLLRDGVDAIGEIPADRFDIDQFYDERPATPGRIMSRRGGFLGRLDQFDAAFFGMSPVQAERLDPQQRLLLETTWEALEDAGQDIAALVGTSTGVFIGQWVADFENRLFADPAAIDFPMTLGSGGYAASGRISYAFGLRGPSLTLDAACSSGLAAVHQAVRSLRAGDGDLALAGGVNVILQPHIHLAYSQSRMMAPDGRCKFGDASGDGYVRAEGVGVVVLKPLATALRDGDRIYAVIRGSAVNNDGDSSGSMGRPSVIGQEELLRAAFRDAGINPSRVGYIEAHGTGTRAGDPIELGALATVLSEGRVAGERAWVGSVKTNFGHTEAAAGVAGLIKTALILQQGMVPPSLHFHTPNPTIPWDTLPVAIPTALTPWPSGQGPRIAGVSSYGIGGTNAHVVLESAPPPPASEAVVASASSAPSLLLPLSARSSAALRHLAGAYAAWMAAHPEVGLEDLCWNVATRRTALDHRAAFDAVDRPGLMESLRAYSSGEATADEGVVHTRPKVAFVVPGQGAQSPGMAREMLAREPMFLAAVEQCDAAARPYIDWSIVEQLHFDPGMPGYLGDRIDVIQPVMVTLAIAYARWLRSLGVEPDAVVGHSMGEVGAAAIAGVLSLDQAMRIICLRSALMRRTSGQGAMALVELPMADVSERIRREVAVSVAVSNSPRSTVISGDPAAVHGLLGDFEREGVFCRLVKVDVASHSRQMEPLAIELTDRLTDLRPSAGDVPIYSTVVGGPADGSQFDAAYWGRNLCQPVRFTQAVASLLEAGVSVFVELSPHPLLTQALQQNAQAAEREAIIVACGHRDQSDRASTSSALARLWAGGAGVEWRRRFPRSGKVLELPFYPWQRERYWIDGATPASTEGVSRRRVVLDDTARSWLYTPRWVPAPLDDGRVPPSHWFVVGDPNVDTDRLVSSLQSASGVVAVGSRDLATEWIETTPEAVLHRLGIVVMVAPEEDEPAFGAIGFVQNLQRAWALRGVGTVPRIWWVTRGAHALNGETPSTRAPQLSALWGAARVVATEHPDWWGGLVDLEDAPLTAARSEVLARHLSGSTEDQVALRGTDRYALRIVRATVTSEVGPSICSWRADAAYLITGGLGGIALEIAKAMVRDGTRRLVLLGRSLLPARSAWAGIPETTAVGRRVAAVRALEHAGASVHLLQADVADEEQLRAALAAYRDEGWPAIRGVIHAAAVLDSHLTNDMDRAAFERVMAPKLAGALNLDRLLPDLDLFVVFSSISAFWAPPGMANYSAANAGLDAVAERRRARGQHAVSIQWGPWAGVGLHEVVISERSTQEMKRTGVGSIAIETGTSLFAAIVGRSEPVITVLPIDWPTYRRARAGRDWPLFRALSEAEVTSPHGSFAARVSSTSRATRRTLFEGVVREVLAAVIRRPSNQLSSRRSFGSMGLDSLMALEFRNRLETVIERSLPATIAWNYPSIQSLVEYLDALFAGEAPAVPDGDDQHAAASEALPLASLLGDVAALSDADVARALRVGGNSR